MGRTRTPAGGIVPGNLGRAPFALVLFQRPYRGVICRILAVCARPGRSRSPLTERALFPGRRTELISEMRAPARLSYGRIPNLVELKDLIATQLESFHWFKSEGLRELFDEINPITDYTGKNFELKFLANGTERVVVSQLVRSPGVYFTAAEDPNTGRKLFGAKLIPNRGAWLEIETSAKDLLTVKIDRKRKVPVTVLLKALELPQLKGTENDREAQKRALLEMFGDVDNNPEHRYMESTLDKDTTMKTEDALLELYRRVRPGDPPSVDNARKLIELNNAAREKQIPDDIDHLGNRRVRAVGELLQNQFRMGLIRMERIIK